MDKFKHGGDVEGYFRKYGKYPIDFSSNINPLPLPSIVREAYINAFDLCDQYPDATYHDIKQAIATFEDVNADRVACGNGAADLIYKIVYAMKPKKALLLAPTFSEYEKALINVDAEIDYHYLLDEYGFELQPDVLDKIKSHDIFFLCNPNNPTGVCVGENLISAIVDECAKQDCLLVVDECFLSFIDGAFSCKSLLGECDNIIILKAFTKIFAMPGLRLGYIIADEKLVEAVSMAGQVWSVSIPAMETGKAVLKCHDYIEQTRQLINKERDYLKSALIDLGYAVYNSCANYVFIKSENVNLSSDIMEHGILIRDCSNYIGLDDRYYRIAVKSHADNEALINILSKVK